LGGEVINSLDDGERIAVVLAGRKKKRVVGELEQAFRILVTEFWAFRVGWRIAKLESIPILHIPQF
jgi:hypothetical protein